MARETITIQRYPDDKIVNDTIQAYELFGWEVIGNQRCQEFTRQDSNGTKHYSTFNKITFSREKSSPWYPEVVKLEQEFDALCNAQDKKNTSARNAAAKYFGITLQSAQRPVMPKIGNGKPAAVRGIVSGSLFLLGIILFLVGAALSNAETEGISILLILLAFGCMVATLVVGIQALVRLKYLKGLKGQEAKDALAKYNHDLEEYNKISSANAAKLNDLDNKIIRRKNEIVARCRQIVR